MTTAVVVAKDVPFILKAIGSIRPSSTVSVKPRVGGVISGVEFEEGEEIETGGILYRIDPKPFEVALAQAQALLAQVREQAQNAQQQVDRYVDLGKTGAVPKEQLDQLSSLARAATSAADAAEATVKEAEIRLGYCTIRSPITGFTGRRMVDPGNVVTANATELVVVNQVKPIEAVFSVAEESLGTIRKLAKEQELPVRAIPTGKSNQVAEGKLKFIDNAVNPLSGTIELKATFLNEDLVLWPGQFINVELELSVDQKAPVIPTAALQTGQHGPYVFVVNGTGTVEIRNVAIKRTLQNEVLLANGLEVGEEVVTDGQVRLFPAAKVERKKLEYR